MPRSVQALTCRALIRYLIDSLIGISICLNLILNQSNNLKYLFSENDVERCLDRKGEMNRNLRSF